MKTESEFISTNIYRGKFQVLNNSSYEEKPMANPNFEATLQRLFKIIFIGERRKTSAGGVSGVTFYLS